MKRVFDFLVALFALLTLLPVLLIDKNDQADPVEVIFNNFIDVSVKTEQQTKLIYLGW